MSRERDTSLDVAIVGMSGRFSGASGIDELWNAVLGGKVLTASAAGSSSERMSSGGVVADAERFDNRFFGISAREAELMDPQHRLLLECAWATLEDAGRVPEDGERIGVYATASRSAHLQRLLNGRHRDMHEIEDLLLANERDYLATRIAYRLGLTGPALTVLTACSSSLTALHLACQALINDECDHALVLAASLRFPDDTYAAIDGGIMSRSGRCRPFDAAADGTVPGSGAIGVLLRRRRDAQEEADRIAALILGTALNNDGARRAGYTAPSRSGQAAVIAAALDVADVCGGTLGYLETHGTGTAVGDPIEWSAASQILRDRGAAPAQVAIGTLKANIGHLDGTAGLAGLVKTVCVLHHGEIPPAAGFTEPNPLLQTSDSPLWVPQCAVAWRGPSPRRAGVISFGVGGTNVHVILEQAPPVEPRPEPAGGPRIVAVSAREPAAAAAAIDRLSRHLSRRPERIDDVAYTLSARRRHFSHRAAVVATSTEAAAEMLRACGGAGAGDPGALVMLLPGQGGNWGGAYRCAEALPGFTDAFDEVLNALPPDVAGKVRRHVTEGASESEASTSLAQPALFAFSYATASALQGLGVQPVAYAGHSVGEIAAAALCGVLDFREAAAFAAERGRIMAAALPGAMITVRIEAERLPEVLRRHDDLDLAAANADGLFVLAGPAVAVDAAVAELGSRARRLNVSHAFHSRAMQAPAEQIADIAAGLCLRPATAAMALGADGRMLQPGETLSPDYFSRQVRQPVLFADCVAELRRQHARIHGVETGPGRGLAALFELAGVRATAVTHGDGSRARALQALADIWVSGHPVDIGALADGSARAVALPTYPFAGQRFGIATIEGADAPRDGADAPAVVPPPPRADAARAHRPAPDDAVLSAWRNVLGDQDLDDGADFFDLGGDSLTATRLAKQIAEALGIAVPIAELLKAPTLGEQRELIRALSAEPADNRSSRSLSAAQQTLWLAHLAASEGDPALHVPLAIRFDGPLDVALVRRALDGAMHRYDALRTRFVVQPKPLQVADLPARWPLDHHDAPLDDDSVRQAIHQATLTPFDLSSGPPVRALLYGTGEEHVLLLVVHHLVCDGWSLSLLAEWLLDRLGGADDGGTAPLPYAEYVDWERSAAGAAVRERDLGYWLDRHRDRPAALELPAARAVPQAGRSDAVRPLRLRPDVRTAVNDLARALAVTPQSIWIAALAVAWQALSGPGTAHVAVPAANRDDSFARTVGAFVSALPLPVDVTSGRSFADVVSDVSSLLLDGASHSAIAAAEVYQRLGSTVPVQPVMCTMYSQLAARRVTGDLSAAPYPARIVGTQFPLSLIVETDRTGAPDARLEASTAAYGPDGLECVANAVETALELCVSEPGARIDETARALGPSGGRLAVSEVGAPSCSVGTALDAFSRSAARWPDRAAAVTAEGSMTYRRLEHLVGMAAAGLHRCGVRRGDRVGVVMPPGAEYLAAVLAVWRLGAVAVPRLTSDPLDRTAETLSRAGAAVQIVSTRAAQCESSTGPRALVWNTLLQPDAGHHTPPIGLLPEDPAYVVFTSGTSGTPKPVGVSHGALANNLGWRLRQIALVPDDRILQTIPVSFDPAFWQCFGPLAAGAAVVFPGIDLGADPDGMVAAAIDFGATIVDIVPSILAALRDESLSRLPCRVVFCGGEALSAAQAARVLRLTKARLYNQYGPSEACIDATSHLCTQADADSGVVPIGRPIDGARVYVLDEEQSRCPVGKAGEIYVGGAGVAIGYLDDPELTTQKFLPDPFAGVAGARMYRTGDQGRWRADATIEYLGRRDGQAKIRGHRVEVEEVEAALRALPHVEDAAVTTAGATKPRLVAYVVAHAAGAGELRARLAERLPAAMVPHEIHLTDSLPRSDSGKLDRAGLARMAAVDSAHTRPVTAATDMERLVVRAFATALDVPAVDPHDDLYELGGASLGAAVIAGELSRALDREVSVRTVLENPVAATLAAVLENGGVPKLRATAELRSDDDTAFEQAYQLRLERAAGMPAPSIVDVCALPFETSQERLECAAAALVARHDALAVLPDTGSRLGDAHGALDAPVADGAPGLDIRLLDTEGYGGQRQAVLRLARNRGDAASLRILAQELDAHLRGRAPDRAAPSYRSYAAERHVLYERAREEQIRYWEKLICPGVPCDLFAARRPAASRSWRGRSVAMDVPCNPAPGRRHLLPVVPYLRALGAVLAPLMASPRFLIAVPVSHRNRRDRLSLVGRCVDLMPVAYEPERSTDAALHRQVSESLDHTAMPYVAMVDDFDPGDVAGRPRLAQVGVNMHLAAEPAPPRLQQSEHWLDLDLLLHVQPGTESTRLALSGATGLFEMDELERLLTDLCGELMRHSTNDGGD